MLLNIKKSYLALLFALVTAAAMGCQGGEGAGDQGDPSCRGAKCDSAGDECAPMDAVGKGSCSRLHGVKWNGSSCVNVSGCSCSGDDCEILFEQPTDCQEAYAACGEQEAGACSAQDASGVGSCSRLHGVKWNGSSCMNVSGCSCSGDDCGDLYMTPAECMAAHQGC